MQTAHTLDVLRNEVASLRAHGAATVAEEPQRSGTVVGYVELDPPVVAADSVDAGGRQLLTFPQYHSADFGELEAALGVLHRLPRHGGRRLVIVEKIDGVPVSKSPHYDTLLACGFLKDYRGLTPQVSSAHA